MKVAVIGATTTVVEVFVISHNKARVAVRCAVPVSPNLREAWQRRSRRAKEQRAIGHAAATAALHALGIYFKLPECRVNVSLARRGITCDDDNLAGAFKSFRDGIAEAVGIDDKHTRDTTTKTGKVATRKLYAWVYEQGPSQRKDPGFDMILELPNHIGRTTKGTV